VRTAEVITPILSAEESNTPSGRRSFSVLSKLTAKDFLRHRRLLVALSDPAAEAGGAAEVQGGYGGLKGWAGGGWGSPAASD
jgi:hypothetical protein